MINRDGATTSLWQATASPYTTNGTVHPKFDVIVVGGGITGVSTAMALQQKGKRCVILEAKTLCFGTTGGTTAHLNTILDTPYNVIEKKFDKEAAQTVATATKEALQLIKNNIDRYQIDCGYSEAAAYLFAQDKDQEKELEAIFSATLDAGVTAAYADSIDVPVPFTRAIRLEGQAQFHPVRYVQALAREFEKLGGVIIENTRVTNVEEKDGVIVETDTGNSFSAADLVYATHIPPGINLLHLRCAPYRSYAVAVELADGRYPENLDYDMYDPYHYYRTQEVDGKKYLIAGGEDHKTGANPNTEHSFLDLESYVQKYFAVERIAYRWSSQYFESADGLAYIGRLPGEFDHVFVATGFGGNGMTYSHIAANILSNMIATGAEVYNSLFNPRRIKPIAGFVNFLSNNLDVTKELVAKLFPVEKLEALSGIARGEGEVVKFENEKLALYKDEEGKMYALHPACSHMKCDVKWNSAERSWDCPCHGARYGIDGQILTGPTMHGLKPAKLASLIGQ